MIDARTNSFDAQAIRFRLYLFALDEGGDNFYMWRYSEPESRFVRSEYFLAIGSRDVQCALVMEANDVSKHADVFEHPATVRHSIVNRSLISVERLFPDFSLFSVGHRPNPMLPDQVKGGALKRRRRAARSPFSIRSA